MRRTQWNDSEDEALHGLPWIAQLVYLRGIRPHMDYASGIVGIKRGISLKSLCEALHVEPGQGRKDSGDPSQKAIRHALELLMRQGLIETIPARMKLVFRLPMADADDSDSEKWGTFGARLGQRKSGTENSQGNQTIKQEEGQTPETKCARMRGIHPESDNPKKKARPPWQPPDWLNHDAWAEFEQHRVSIRHKLTDDARRKNATVLEGLTHAQQQEVIDNSIRNNYRGLFPLKVNGSRQSSQTDNQPTPARRRRLSDAA